MSSDHMPGEGIPVMSDRPNPDDATIVSERDQLAGLTLDYLDVLNGSRDTLPELDDLGDDLRQRVLDAWSVIDRLVVNEPLPPIDADPVAVALNAAPNVDLDPAAVHHARQAQHLRPSDVARLLQKRGWSTTTAEVFAWERHPHPVAPALLADLAAALDVASDTLHHRRPRSQSTDLDIAGGDDATESLLEVLYSDDLNEIVDQWALLLRVEPAAARQDLQRRVASLAHRGSRTLTAYQWKAVLQVLLAAERVRLGHPDHPVDRM